MFAAIQSALDTLAASLPDAALRMSHKDEAGTALAVSSVDMSQDPVTSDAPVETRRVTVPRCAFPTLGKGATVLMGDRWYLVTSCRLDPVGASMSCGLSAPLDAMVADYRRAGTDIRQPVNMLAVESDVLDAWSDNIAPTTCRAWFCVISAEHWLDVTEPQVGDELVFDGRRLRVAQAAKRDGYFHLTCRARR